MRFYSEEFVVPEMLQAGEFIFRPLRASDVELDFDAVVSSSFMLRAWSQSDWPIDGFTLEENLEDLQRHEQEHLKKKAFTYTIMNQEETFCFGCMYMSPLIQEEVDLDVCRQLSGDEEKFAASVRFWVRKSYSTKELNSQVLGKIIQWLDSAWYFNCVVFPVAITDSLQNRLFAENDFVLVGDIYYEPGHSHWNIYQKNY
jgi:hypothetical protein